MSADDAAAPVEAPASESIDEAGSRAPALTQDLEMLAHVAHELRGPLAVVATTVDLLAEVERQSPAQPLIHHLQVQAFLLQNIVENLLCSAVLLAGKLQLERQPLDLTELLREVGEATAPVLAQRRHRVRSRVIGTVPPVLADGRRLRQSLTNLLLNASTHTAVGSTLHILVFVKGRSAYIVLRDRRPDLQYRDVLRVLDSPTESLLVEPSDSRRGLALTKVILQRHGGMLHVRDRHGRAHVWVELPLRAARSGRSSRRGA